MKFLATILLLMFVNAPAFGVTIPIHPSQCYGALTDGAERVGPLDLNDLLGGSFGSTPTMHVRFADGDTLTAYCDFNYPYGAPYTLGCTGASTPFGCCTGSASGCDDIIDFDMARWSTASDGAVVWNVDITCQKNNDTQFAGDFTFPGASNVTDSSIDTATDPYVSILNDAAIIGSAAAPGTGAQCKLKIIRVGDNVSDTNTGTAYFDGGVIRVYPQN